MVDQPDAANGNIATNLNNSLMLQDLEADLPQAVKDLNQSIAWADAALLATPEYNRSYSPVLKNANSTAKEN